MTVHTKKICFWNGCRRSAVGKRFCLFSVQTLKILLIPRRENWTRAISSGSWKKELNEKSSRLRKRKHFRCFYTDVCIFDFGKSFQGDPHGSFLGNPCHLCFGGIIFCHCCFMYLIFVRSYIYNESRSGRDSTGFITVMFGIHKYDWVLRAYLAIGWEIIRVKFLNGNVSKVCVPESLQHFYLSMGSFSFSHFYFNRENNGSHKVSLTVAKNELSFSLFRCCLFPQIFCLYPVILFSIFCFFIENLTQQDSDCFG